MDRALETCTWDTPWKHSCTCAVLGFFCRSSGRADRRTNQRPDLRDMKCPSGNHRDQGNRKLHI